MNNMESPQIRAIVAQLKLDGYTPVVWERTGKGFRAKTPGKRAIPSHYTAGRVCLKHGNLVLVRTETFPGHADRGVVILDVAPCPFCRRDAAEILAKTPPTVSFNSRTRTMS